MSTRKVRYEDFANGGKMRMRRSDSPSDAVEILLARARGQARADGFAEGVEQTEARIKRELEALISDVSAAIAHEKTRRDGARKKAAAEALAVMMTFLRAVAPHLAKAGLAAEISSALSHAYESAPGAALTIEVHPDQQEAVASALKEADAKITASPALRESEARIRWDGGFDLIDTSAAINRALTVLEAHLSAHQTQQNNSEEPEHD